MITRSEFPSYGYWIEHGATTFWELFSPIEYVQSSCNHHFFGDILSWFVKSLAGICPNPDGKNSRSVVIAPHFPAGMQDAQACVELPCGCVKSSWTRNGEEIILHTDVPAGAEAVLRLDAAWQTDKGFSQCKLQGDSTVRLIPANQRHTMKKTAQ